MTLRPQERNEAIMGRGDFHDDSRRRETLGLNEILMLAASPD
jgi:hypothetical protein